MVLALKSATTNDVEIIAKMNFQLIEDEGSTNPMNITQLQDRMLNWLSHGWDADLLVFQEKIVGYAVYKFQMNSFDDTKKGSLHKTILYKERRTK
ncbi:hypothetical protein OMP38_11625 [Cohnella ginsengisoli]|uniref:Uncharacterized protein n=1 Tax=Cohnella ginsengisoli TaxID=425004 RepID=A0A9X4KGB4_9BACL|nr:hypothetical protein [Cohnella ginsengisoli]MDG0791443.1 hypothetical protein [Cohnella ginsengisoli]